MVIPEYRRMSFDFEGAPVPFLWNPTNPGVSVQMNAVSFLAVAWERYITMAVKGIQQSIHDPQVRAEAKVFLNQEGQHSSAHRKHVLALCATYPNLQSVLDSTIERFDKLRSEESTRFHVAYMANIEATFPALFGVIMDYQDELFSRGDQRVASLMLWHFVEEIEHKSSALAIYEATEPSRWYRTTVMRKSLQHMGAAFQGILAGFHEALPAEFAKIAASSEYVVPSRIGRSELVSHLQFARRRRSTVVVESPYAQIPGRRILSLFARILLSQTPLFNAEREPVPTSYRTWMDQYRAGTDMARYIGQPAGAILDPAC
ncbi:metal-dependent hydrolase [Mycobacteroides salmoniphilum]|uniref:metal-dependent hydrolase n=1 Tax=Mycobacteroides salmoniphilum TaxID=404941 RepID=UPI0012FFC773|nr:metal-dependent hydrolase [Mycobacteroides salmoniphilum]